MENGAGNIAKAIPHAIVFWKKIILSSSNKRLPFHKMLPARKMALAENLSRNATPVAADRPRRGKPVICEAPRGIYIPGHDC
jgi:hypothetical protein